MKEKKLKVVLRGLQHGFCTTETLILILSSEQLSLLGDKKINTKNILNVLTENQIELTKKLFGESEQMFLMKVAKNNLKTAKEVQKNAKKKLDVKPNVEKYRIDLEEADKDVEEKQRLYDVAKLQMLDSEPDNYKLYDFQFIN